MSSAPRPSPRRRAAWLAALALACAALVLGLLLAGRDGLDGGAAPLPEAAGAPRASPPGPALAGEAPPPPRSDPAPADARAPEVDAAGFDGLGTLRGEVVVRPGVSMPDVWTLEIGPSDFLAGSARAAVRQVQFQHGEPTFRVDGLPLAGYRVRARALGLNSRSVDVLLVRGSPDQFLTLAFEPGGFLDGGVLQSDGTPADGLPVTLEEAASLDRQTRLTDLAGVFRFQPVVDGEYRLYFGRPEAPLLEPEHLAFQAPSFRLPTRTLPPTASLRVRVLDAAGRPVAGAALAGSTKAGGALDARTEDGGEALLRWLRPGTWRIRARGGEGEEAVQTVELEASASHELELRLRLRSP